MGLRFHIWDKSIGWKRWGFTPYMDICIFDLGRLSFGFNLPKIWGDLSKWIQSILWIRYIHES